METNIIVCPVLGWLVWNRVRMETNKNYYSVSCAGLIFMEQGEEGNYYYSVSRAGLVGMKQGEDGN